MVPMSPTTTPTTVYSRNSSMIACFSESATFLSAAVAAIQNSAGSHHTRSIFCGEALLRCVSRMISSSW